MLRASGCASNTLDDKWLLKSVLRGLLPLPGDEGASEEAKHLVQPHYPAPVDLSSMTARARNMNLREAVVLQVSL